MKDQATRLGKHAAMIQMIADQLRQLSADSAAEIDPGLLANSLDHIAADLIAASIEPTRGGPPVETDPVGAFGLPRLVG